MQPPLVKIALQWQQKKAVWNTHYGRCNASRESQIGSEFRRYLTFPACREEAREINGRHRIDGAEGIMLRYGLGDVYDSSEPPRCMTGGNGVFSQSYVAKIYQ